MRIGVNTRFLIENKLEGIGGYTAEIMRRMVAAHPEDEFVFFFDRAYSEVFIYGKNVTPVVLFPPARHGILWYWWFEFSIKKALKKYRCDVFFSPDGYLSLATDTPTVMVAHDIIFAHYTEGIPKWAASYYNYFTPLFFKKATKIISVSEFVKQDIIQKYGIDKNKISVAHNACRTFFKPLSVDKQQVIRKKHSSDFPYFFYIGAIHPRKNVARLIIAFDLFKKQTHAPHQLLLGGRLAWQTDEVNAAFKAATHQDSIVFLDYITDDALVEILASAEALVYVSLLEGFGVPLLEAMHCDVPVISSFTSSMPEVVEDAALLVNPYNVAEIAAAMQSLYEQADLRRQLIEKARVQRIKFSWDNSAALIYEELKNSYKI